MSKMATISTFSAALHSVCKPNSCTTPSHPLVLVPIKILHVQRHGIGYASSFKNSTLNYDNLSKSKNSNAHYWIWKLRAIEEETPVLDEGEEQVQEEEAAEEEPQQQPVSVPVSPSDTLTMHFQAEGTMNEAAIPTVTKALQQAEGIANLRVQVVEGIASVELTKQTTVQATGVASSLVELIQGSGFKLQTLNLSFADEEEDIVVV